MVKKNLLVFLLVIIITTSAFGCETLPGKNSTGRDKLPGFSISDHPDTTITIVESTFEPNYEGRPTYEEIYEKTGSTQWACLVSSRPWEAYNVPGSLNKATSIRISFITRDIDGSLFFDYRSDFTNKEKKNAKFCQLYYGYCINGKWYDMPAEKYDLRVINYSSSYGAAGRAHLVVFGDYVLIALPVGRTEKETATVVDTLGSEVICFDEYSNNGTRFNNYQTIYHIFEDIEVKDGYETTKDYFHFRSAIWRFILVKIDQITEDYVITVSNDWNILEYTYTYDDIMEALNRE